MTMFVATFTGVAMTAQQDLFEVVAPSGAPVCLHRCVITQGTELGDTGEEELQILFKRGQTTSGSGGTGPTAVDTGLTGYTFGGTIEVNNTTKASAGTILTLHSEYWNVRGSFDWLPTPEGRLWIPAGGRGTIELASTPADSITASGTLLLEV